MKRVKLQDLSADQLVERFATIGVDQDKALLRREHAKFNRLFDEKRAVERELKSRNGDQRHALLNLYSHPNAQVRLNAVKATLAVAPEAARAMLHVMAESREYPQAGDAGMTLDALDRGIFKPA
jgi:hypothetical protein